MTGGTILDTGPLVALLNRHDAYHEWSCSVFALTRRPMLTCESVLAEACFKLRHVPADPPKVAGLVQAGAIEVVPVVREHAGEIARLMRKYSNLPMSLADACLVILSERVDDCRVLTIDAHFRLYRQEGAT